MQKEKKKERLKYIRSQIQTYELTNKKDILKNCTIIPGQPLPKKKYGDMYIINNLLSDCKKFSIDEDKRLIPLGQSFRDEDGILENKYKYGFKNYDIIFTWLKYIQKYHVQENVACMPNNTFADSQIIKLDSKNVVSMICGYIYYYPDNKLRFIINPVIKKLLKTCSKPLLLIPSTMVAYDQKKRQLVNNHSILIMINYTNKII